MLRSVVRLVLRPISNVRLQRYLTSDNNSATSDSNSNESAQFGYQEVKADEKQGKVNKVFSAVAQKYDLMNDLMSFGLHRIWKEKFINAINPQSNLKLIDVAGGTGDIAFRYLYNVKNQKNLESNTINKVTICDINANMLEVGKQRAEKLGYSNDVEFLLSNAEDLSGVKDSQYDVYTISFGIRNCTHVDKVLKEAYRVLKKGGRVMVLEFSRVDNEILRNIYDKYSFNIIPLTGHLVAGDWNSYQYLVESIRVFPSQTEFSQLMKECGFKFVTYESLTYGVCTIYSGFKL